MILLFLQESFHFGEHQAERRGGETSECRELGELGARSRGAVETAEEACELACRRQRRMLLENEVADLFRIAFGKGWNRCGGQLNRLRRLAGAAKVTMATRLFRERFSEIAEQSARDTSGMACELENLREPLRIARLALRKKLRLPRGDSHGIARGAGGSSNDAHRLRAR